MDLQATESSVSFGESARRTRTRRKGSAQRVRGDPFFELWSSFAELQEKWRTSSFSLQKIENPTILGTRWRAYLRIHVHGERKLWLGSFIHLWPSLRSVRNRGGWHPRLVERGWYEACSGHLAQLGYIGEWGLWDVRHGEFRKRLKDPKAGMAEVTRLGRLDIDMSLSHHPSIG